MADASVPHASGLKVLMVNGSPHRHGCTNRALEEISSALGEQGVSSEVFWIGTKPLASCIGCKRCAESGKCVFDDRVNEFVDVALDYDGYALSRRQHGLPAQGAAPCP